MQAYFISVVWSCYKFLCLASLGGQPGRGIRATDFGMMELVHFDRAALSSSSAPQTCDGNMTLGTELMVSLLSLSSELISISHLVKLCLEKTPTCIFFYIFVENI